MLIDGAQTFVESKIPPVSTAQLESQILLADQESRRLGLTTVHDAGTNSETVEAYKRLIDAGRLKTRLYVMLRGSLPTLTPFFQKGAVTNYANHHLAVRAIKIQADGRSARAAPRCWIRTPTIRTRRDCLTTPPEEIYAQTLAASKAGFQTSIHAIGDRANRIVMDTFERVQREVPGARDLRMRNEHAQILDAAEIPRFAALHVIASMQATHATSDMPWVPARIGSARMEEGAYVWQKLLKSGALIANGSDFPVEEPNPMFGFYAAITRQDRSGNPPGSWIADQRMSRAEALKALTLDAAYAAHAETLLGSLEPGKLADLGHPVDGHHARAGGRDSHHYRADDDHRRTVRPLGSGTSTKYKVQSSKQVQSALARPPRVEYLQLTLYFELCTLYLLCRTPHPQRRAFRARHEDRRGQVPDHVERRPAHVENAVDADDDRDRATGRSPPWSARRRRTESIRTGRPPCRSRRG